MNKYEKFTFEINGVKYNFQPIENGEFILTPTSPESPSFPELKRKNSIYDRIKNHKLIEAFNNKYKKKLLKMGVTVLPVCAIIFISLLGIPILI